MGKKIDVTGKELSLHGRHGTEIRESSIQPHSSSVVEIRIVHVNGLSSCPLELEPWARLDADLRGMV